MRLLMTTAACCVAPQGVHMRDPISEFVTNLIAAWNRHDIEAAGELYAADYRGVDVCEANPQEGPEALRRTIAGYLHAFPDLHIEPIETVIQDTRAAVRWIAHGTHQGPLMNIPATGRPVTFCGTWFLNLKDGKVTQGQTIWDVAGVLREIGLLPEL